MPTATSSSGRKYPVDEEYEPPSKAICDFLINSFAEVSQHQRDTQDMAKRLLVLYDGPGKQQFNVSIITGAFPWMYQAGILDYEHAWHGKYGFRLLVWRATGPDHVRQVLTDRPHYLNGEPVGDTGTGACAPVESEPQAPPLEKKRKKKRKKCCPDPRIVKSKSTGKRRCKNCGRKLKAKKKP